jgi:2-polyprenyl-3-methyl-5-hydroxy-6-metoxy-1,4-benzoquinol methylase
VPEGRDPALLVAGCPCGGAHLSPAWRYDAPPEGETGFPALRGRYRRTVHRCAACGHLGLDPGCDLAGLYAGGYADATYGDRLRATFARITGLPPERSDNAGRVARVLAFADGRLTAPAAGVRRPRVLDVGSGLAVFPWAMARRGWDVLAVDPDPRQAALAREVAGVPCVCADLMDAPALGTHDVVTLNKVLEHVDDPVAMLAAAAGHLLPGGFVYVEVPDGDAAAHDGPGREEFFIEHLHAFSPASVAALVLRAGLSPVRVERLREPSGKYTLVAFCVGAE